jgi:SAM-dependent methyltransferase/uncharacterized protein YbaR (Trm112 family)
MRDDLLRWLACPVCRGEGWALSWDEMEAEEVVRGLLRCQLCGHVFVVERGIPRLLPEAGRFFAGMPGGASRRAGSVPELERSLRLTITHYPAYQARAYAGLAERLDNAAILEARTGLRLVEFEGKACLDAGCGVGRMARLLAASGAATVVGLDAGWAVDEARKRSPARENLHWVQGDVLRAPFRPGSFDRVLSLGVLHHTREPDRGFRMLADLVTDGGTLSLYLYPRNAPSYRYARSLRALFWQARETLLVEPTRRFVVRWPDPMREGFARLMWGRRRGIEWLRRRGAVGGLGARLGEVLTPPDAFKPRESAASNRARIFDMYSTPHNFSHHLLEVFDWFEQDGRFTDLVVTPFRHSVTGTRGERAAGEPLYVRYHRRRSMEEIESRGVRAS